MKLWEKDYQLDKLIEQFTVGDDYLLDLTLVKYDCLGSIAHAEMLGKTGILTEDEVARLKTELEKIIALTDRDEFEIKSVDEDCHTAIENHLTARLGELGKKIHTARSRNDQVVTAMRLYLKDELNTCKGAVKTLTDALSEFIATYGAIALPGYTHTRKAMPSSIAMWAGSFKDAMADNIKMLNFNLELIDQSPLGTAAGYGLPIVIDREYTAELLGFARVQENPIYVQTSRGKFASTIIHTLTQIMLDLNKMATDLILISMPTFGFFVLPPQLCTGSSIMPQKKNPDVLELVRAKYHIVLSNELQVKSMIGNLITGYHRDFQLTKKPVMESLAITLQSLEVMALVVAHLKVDERRCQAALTDELYATERVYELVKAGVPFRDAYRRVAEQYSGTDSEERSGE